MSNNTRTFLYCDIAALISSFALALCVAPYISDAIFHNSTIFLHKESYISKALLFSTITIAVLFTFYNKGHYTTRIPFGEQTVYIFKACLFALLIDVFFQFLIKEHFSRVYVALSWGLAFTFLLLSRQAARTILKKQGNWAISCVIIGDNEDVCDTLLAISSDYYCGYKTSTLLLREQNIQDFNKDNLPLKDKNIEILDGFTQYSTYINEHKEKLYIIALDSFRGEERDNLLNSMRENDIQHVIMPPTGRISLYGMESQFFFGHDVMFLRRVHKIRAPFGKIIKRLIDIGCSAIAMGIFGVFLPIIALIIKRDGGSIFYGDKRIGKNGKEFTCWKFRSMYPDANERLIELLKNDPQAREEHSKDFKLKNDPRITKIGHFIRKSSIDELPQLWNIIRGEMSIVGPRPIVQAEVEKYKNNYRLYKTVKPGLTGLWQVSGRNDISYEQRVRLDCWYVRNWSVWHDIVIIMKTIRVVIFKSGAY